MSTNKVVNLGNFKWELLSGRNYFDLTRRVWSQNFTFMLVCYCVILLQYCKLVGLVFEYFVTLDHFLCLGKSLTNCFVLLKKHLIKIFAEENCSLIRDFLLFKNANNMLNSSFVKNFPCCLRMTCCKEYKFQRLAYRKLRCENKVGLTVFFFKH